MFVLAPETPHQAALDAQVVLVGSAKVGVQIFHLDRPERDMLRQGDIGSAAGRHRKRVARSRTETRRSSRELLSAEQRLHVRKHPSAASREVHPGTEQVIDLVRRRARRQAGNLAAAYITDNADTLGQIGAEGTRTALAVDARSAAAWVNPDELIVAGNLKPSALLGVSGRCRNRQQPAHNQ